MGLDLPNFPPSTPDARYSMLFSSMVTIISMMFEYAMVADLRWGSAHRKGTILTDARMIALQLRESWELVAIAVFLAKAELPEGHPFRTVACGFAAAYISGKLAFNVYHMLATAVACLAFGVRHETTALAATVQMLEPLVCTAMLASLASIAAMLSPTMPAGEALSISLRALRWSFTGIDCPIGVAGGLVTALLLLRVQGRLDEKHGKEN
jgi:hypothetical protein